MSIVKTHMQASLRPPNAMKGKLTDRCPLCARPHLAAFDVLTRPARTVTRFRVTSGTFSTPHGTGNAKGG